MGNNNKKVQAVEGQNATNRGNGAGGGRGGGNVVLGATQKMKLTIDNLEKRRNLLETRSRQYKSKALEYKKSGNINRAKMSLKRMQQANKFIETVDAQIFTLQEQQLTLEQASVTKDIIDARSGALNAQRRLNRQLNVEQVEDLVANQEEINEDVQEINDILAPAAFDNEDELEAMLEGLDADEVENTAFVAEKPNATGLDLPAVPTEKPLILPNAPTKPVTIKQDEDEALLAELAADFI